MRKFRIPRTCHTGYLRDYLLLRLYLREYVVVLYNVIVYMRSTTVYNILWVGRYDIVIYYNVIIMCSVFDFRISSRERAAF